MTPTDPTPAAHELHLTGRAPALTSADVTTTAAPGGTAVIRVHAESGHIPPGVRAALIDSVLDLPDVRHSRHLCACVPLGDSESLLQFQARCEHVSARAAGSSALIEADLPQVP
jgi:hypothetical protein